MYVLRTGCQWKALPSERFGSASAIHTRYLEWQKVGVFEALWKAGLAEYDDCEGMAWRWQRIDGALMKAPLAQPTSVCRCGLYGRSGAAHHRRTGLPSPCQRAWARRHGEAPTSDAASAAMGGGGRAERVHSLSQAARAIRETRTQCPGTHPSCCGDHRIQEGSFDNKYYLWISS